MTSYVNTVNVRSVGRDVVLEFGCFFPESGQPYPPKGHPPELRVVMSGDLLGPLLEILRERVVSMSPGGGDRAN